MKVKEVFNSLEEVLYFRYNMYKKKKKKKKKEKMEKRI